MTPPAGNTRALWSHDVDVDAGSPPPAVRGHVEVCVVGAGIAGLTTAYLLAKQGKQVIVLDEGPVGSGQTGRTSAHLASAIDDRFVEIERMHGEQGAKLAYASHAAAIDRIESIAADERIDCDFARLPGYLWAAGDTPRDELEREAIAARKAGLAAELFDDAPSSMVARGPCIRFPDQARFHPMKYLLGLAAAAARAGVTIHSGARVTQVHGRASSKPARVCLADGDPFTADAVLVATNTPGPLHDWAGIYFKQAPYRSYVIGLWLKPGSVEDALYCDTLDPYHYVRVKPAGRDHPYDVLVVGGEDHKTGQVPDDAAPFAALERWARDTFPAVGEVISRWSGQVQEPTDGLGFIGRAPVKGEGVFVITGDSGMGLTHGTLGAMLVSDLVLGRANPWEQLYDPRRKPLHSLKTFALENMNTGAQWLELVTPGETRDVATIPPGSGAIVRRGLGKLAVFRDDLGKLHTCSAVCPHLGAIVQWNPIEHSWDCPAHGSRFAATGELLLGPATDDLARVGASPS
jgi:glycine/D-amino acid oxidase-like deaminating enzyme/nitrite reductase/ring-hydroxylating ferredoxin subunit